MQADGDQVNRLASLSIADMSPKVHMPSNQSALSCIRPIRVLSLVVIQSAASGEVLQLITGKKSLIDRLTLFSAGPPEDTRPLPAGSAQRGRGLPQGSTTLLNNLPLTMARIPELRPTLIASLKLITASIPAADNRLNSLLLTTACLPAADHGLPLCC